MQEGVEWEGWGWGGGGGGGYDWGWWGGGGGVCGELGAWVGVGVGDG